MTFTTTTTTKPWDESHKQIARFGALSLSLSLSLSLISTLTHTEMSSCSGDIDGRKGRKEGEKKRMSAETNHITQKSRMIQRKGKALEIVRQRSDLGIKKSPPPQIKRARSATISVRDETTTNLVKLRKIKSDSSKLAGNSLVHPKANSGGEDLETEKSRIEEEDDDDGQVKAIIINAENQDQDQDLDLDLEEEKEEEEEEEEVEVEVEEVEKKIEEKVEIKDIVISLEGEEKKKAKNSVIEEKNLIPSKDRSPPIAAVNHARIQENLTPTSDHHHGASSRLQTLADLIMWRDVSRSAFVFGIGSFAIISSSYTQDLNISFISVVSYLGLLYLAVSFTFRSIIRRGNVDMEWRDEKEEYVVGEEEVAWLVKLVLPFLNEFLSKLRGLFSGDPPTTMKLAILLFVLAKCGGSITLWKMAKLGFFGVFMVPKLCSSYSSQFTAHGTFWIRRFGDAWESCSHKKAVAFGMFSLVWNLSSVVARIWTAFLLFVAYRYYQQCRVEEEAGAKFSDSEYAGKRVRARKSNVVDINKPNKVC